jgi:hypothetical protein
MKTFGHFDVWTGLKDHIHIHIDMDMHIQIQIQKHIHKHKHKHDMTRGHNGTSP